MEFIEKADVLRFIDSDTLDVITESDDTELDTAEASAIQEMSGYLNVRYNVDLIFDPDETRNELIVTHLISIMLHDLHAKASPDNIPELREKRYNNAINWLEKIADGFISPLLPVKSEDEKLPIRYGSSAEKQDHYY